MERRAAGTKPKMFCLPGVHALSRTPLPLPPAPPPCRPSTTSSARQATTAPLCWCAVASRSLGTSPPPAPCGMKTTASFAARTAAKRRAGCAAASRARWSPCRLRSRAGHAASCCTRLTRRFADAAGAALGCGPRSATLSAHCCLSRVARAARPFTLSHSLPSAPPCIPSILSPPVHCDALPRPLLPLMYLPAAISWPLVVSSRCLAAPARPFARAWVRQA